MSDFWSYAAEFLRARQQREAELAQGISQGIGAIGQGIQTGRQNALANAIGAQMNSGANAPRAGLVSPGDIPTYVNGKMMNSGIANTIPAGTPTAGTNPAFIPGSGQRGLQFAIEQQRQQQAQKNQLVENALKGAQTNEANARTQYTQGALSDAATARAAAARNAPALKAQQEAQRQQQWADDHADTMEKFNKDLKSEGWSDDDIKSMVSAAQGPQAGGSITRGRYATGPDNKQYFVADPKGDVTSLNPSAVGAKAPAAGFMGSGLGAEAGVQSVDASPILPTSQGQAYIKRYQNIAGSPNGRYVPPMPQQPTPPQAGGQPSAPGGNGPPRVQSQQDYDAISSGQQYVDPTGVVRTKQ